MQCSTCLMTVMVSCVLVVACSEGETTTFSEMPLPALSLKPGCYTPGIQLGTCTSTVCDAARASNAEVEASARSALAPYVQMSKEIALDPAAAQWTFTYQWPPPHELNSEFTVTPLARGEAGLLELSIHDRGTWQGETGARDVDSVSTVYASYTPNFALVDLETDIVRWTAHAVEAGAIYRGCEPDSGISFDARLDDEGVYGLFCWDSAGHNVDCAEVDLWPR